jgi:methylglutaconyl-CoA hydratase
MTYETLQTSLQHGVAVIWLNRPDLRNAMNETVIAELTRSISEAIGDDAVRAIVIAGRGKAFCAGADLNWLRRARDMTPDEAVQDSAGLATVLRLLYESPKPTVARVHGAAFAGGLGIVSACDIAIAATEATFCLSEAKLGLLPAMISPYVIRAIGEPHARRYFLTGEVFDAAEAYRIGLVDDIVAADALDAAVNRILGHLLLGGPISLAENKQLIRDVVGRHVQEDPDRQPRRNRLPRRRHRAPDGHRAPSRSTPTPTRVRATWRCATKRIALGPAPARESYLRGDLVHPRAR